MRLEQIYSLIKGKLADSERLIREELASDIPIVREMGVYITESGGKRIRPALLCLCAGACGYSGDKDVRYGVVFEFVHTATLIHDDIIDNSDLRRGRIVLNRTFGTTLSILFGDLLFNNAMRLALRDDDFRIVRLICEATDKMIGGEIIQSRRNFNADLTMADYLDLIQRKTAWIFASAARAAAILADGGDDIEKEMFSYGMNLGMAFQLIDDYFDYASSEKQLGKPVASDLREGKITHPLLVLQEMDGGSTREIVREAFARQRVDNAESAEIINRLRLSGALERTKEEARAYARRAIDNLGLLPESRYTQALRRLPDLLVEREK